MYLITLCNRPARAILKRRPRFSSKTLLVMKLTAFFFTVAMLNVSAKGVSQNISLSANRLPIEKVFTVIKQQTGYVVFYNYEFLERARPVTIRLISRVNSPSMNSSPTMPSMMVKSGIAHHNCSGCDTKWAITGLMPRALGRK